MNLRPPIPLILILLFTILLAHLGALFFNFYWQIFWYDKSIHFISGFLVGLVFLWIFSLSSFGGQRLKTRKGMLILSVAASFLVGVLWEVFEYFSGTTFSIGLYTRDAFLDLFFGSLGGYFAFLYFFNKGYNKTDGKI